MERNELLRWLLTGFFVAAMGIFVAASPASAQKKASKAKPRATPKPLATPPILSGAEIISRSADDYAVPTATPAPVQAEKQADPAPTTDTAWLKELQDRINKLETGTAKKETYEDRQKRLLLNLDILTRAEQRSESLRKQVFELTDKENAIKTRIDQIDYDSRPEVIERILQMSGSLRPEEIRDARRKALLAEKTNLQRLLVDIQTSKDTLNGNLTKADEMVEKLRNKLEKDIDDSFLNDKPGN